MALNFKERFSGKTAVIGKTGILDAINSVSTPIVKGTQLNLIKQQSAITTIERTILIERKRATNCLS
jgi:hypothetical protein